jgi:hypothetical protein
VLRREAEPVNANSHLTVPVKRILGPRKVQKQRCLPRVSVPECHKVQRHLTGNWANSGYRRSPGPDVSQRENAFVCDQNYVTPNETMAASGSEE